MPKISLTEKLQHWVAGGGRSIGEVAIAARGEGNLRLCHIEDGDQEGLERFSSPAAARLISRYDDAGNYRPLKSAPGLRHGWELRLRGFQDLREALDYFYPAALGTWFADQESRIEAVPLREVLGRQTGMYRFSNNLSDQGAQALVGTACAAQGGCLKRVCWKLDAVHPIDSLPASELGREGTRDGEMPMLCVEACNWLVAKARQASADEFQAASGE